MSTYDPTDGALRASILHTVAVRVAAEPRPTPSRAFLAAVRRLAPTDAAAALLTAWRLATLRGRPIALGVRVRAAGLALGVGGLLATSGAVALASVAGVANDVVVRLNTPAQVEPTRPAPASTASPSAHPVVAPPTHEAPNAAPVPSPSISAAPSPAAIGPSPSASPSPRPTHSPRPTSTPRDSGGQHGSGGTPRPTAPPTDGGWEGGDGGDPGGSGGGDGGGPHATRSPEPTDTPEPVQSEGATGG